MPLADPPPRSEPGWSTAFLAALLHELRTPLASLLLCADLLAGDGELDARQSRYARSLLAAGGDLRGLLDELGELNRLRAGRVEAAPVEVTLRDLLATVVEGCAGLLQPAGLELALTVAADAPAAVRTDAPRLVRIVRLVVAAALAAGARRVELRAAAAADELRLSVHDDGAAIATEEAAALFVPFAAGSARAQRPLGGHSLGLPLAAALAALLGGSLSAASDAEGARLTLTLPR